MRAFFTLLLGILLIIAFYTTAGADDDNQLTIGLTDEELLRLDEIGIKHITTAPPPTPIRAVAEWESSTGVLIRWPLGIPYDIIAEMSEDVVVLTIVGSSSQQTSAVSAYTSNGVNMANTEFLIASTNTYWTRDYGPWYIFDGNDEMAIVDHIYNRPRPYDDQIPWTLGSLWVMDVFGMNLINTGGNHMTDGLGRSFATQLVYDENTSLTAKQVDSILYAFMGNDYEVLPYIESGGIHHIDCWAKLLNPATILVKDVPASSSSYALLNARAQYLSQMTSAWGIPYNIVRVYCPYGTAYTNALILNKKVLVPTFGSSWDDSAIAVYQNAMPGYEVLGFDGSWLDDDAIHCRAKGIPDRYMLYIGHTPLTTTGDTINPYEVSVRIHAYSDFPLISDSLKIYYRSKTQFTSTSLVATAVADSFVGYIPAASPGTEISYFIKAADESGRVETHPYIGEPWAHKFNVNCPPAIIAPDTLIYATGATFGFCPDISDPDDSTHDIAYIDIPDWLIVQNDSLVGTVCDSAVDMQFAVQVSDPYSTSEETITLLVYVCGDANGDGAVNVGDAVFVINYAFNGGSAPVLPGSGDANGDGLVNVGDVVYVVNFVFKSGPPPACN